MAAQSGELRMQMVFGRAFLLELERGNLQNATVFARAFLKHHARPVASSRFTADATRAAGQ